MSFTLKPTRMSVTDLRPSLSYRVGVSVRSRAAQHWVELALATDASLFDPDNASSRSPATFAALGGRFPLMGETAVLHVPPQVLLALAGGNRLYAGAALFESEAGASPVSVISPDSASVYVASDGFSGAGIRQRFGFAGRPGLTGTGQAHTNANLVWAGDQAAPTMAEGAAPVPSVSAAPSPDFTNPGSRAGARELPTEGTLSMNSHSFMHQNLHHPQAQQPHMQPAGAMDYDDGYGEPPMAMPPSAQPMGGGLPYGGVSAGGTQPLDLVLPEFKDYSPSGIWNTLKSSWARYESFTAGVADTSQFPFSAIVLLDMYARLKSDHSVIDSFTGTGFYIAPNIILTAAHNFAEDSEYEAAHKVDVYVGHNSKRGVGGGIHAADAISAFSVTPSDYTLNPHYKWNASRAIRDEHDIAVIRTSVAPPNGHYFEIAQTDPALSTKIAVCGYAGSSSGQSSSGLDWRKLLPTAQADYKQHLDADMIRAKIAGGEAITYNLQTLSGTSGSPVFIQPQASMEPADAVKAMQIVGVHRRSKHDDETNTNFRNVGVLMTKAKRDWALSGGQMSIPLGMHAEPMTVHPGYHQHVYAEEQILPAALLAWVAGVTAAEWIAIGISGLALGVSIYQGSDSSDDIKWQVARMKTWLEPGTSGPKETKDANISNAKLHTLKLIGPKWDPSGQGMLYADFELYFETDDNGGIGKIRMGEKPINKKDTSTGALAIAASINPRGGNTYTSKKDPSKKVARVDVLMEYLADWTMSADEKVSIRYSLYGDGTVESKVVTGAELVDDSYLIFKQRARR